MNDKYQNWLVNILVTIIFAGLGMLFASGVIALTIKLWDFIL
ncbi:hypothetical protein N7L96_01940 [Mammaliicoccus sciuri]|nr:hypothetical protein [Mammaliicoccus sciuri]MDC5693349.1 hypothetical protein [Mammaliicoccus sciuri]